MKIPSLKIGELTAKIPIIQGGMGIGVSLSKLASSVANEGGIGIISAAQIGYREPDFESNVNEANLRGLQKEIRIAKESSRDGILGVNILVAMKNYREMVLAAVKEKINLIISGAGLPTDLPAMVKGSDTKIAPIVSSGRAAALIAKLWDHKYGYAPDLVIVEGPEAGGHLGFSLDQLNTSPKIELADIVKNVIEALKSVSEKYKKNIPVVAAGGIYNGQDIAKYLEIGASGVQMATRFVATEECDAHINFKNAYINSKRQDIEIVKSPLGMPGRAIRNKFTDMMASGNLSIKRCYNCIKNCEPKTAPYCITKALVEAVKGNTEEGLIFSGSNAYLLDRITSVKKLMTELADEAIIALSQASPVV